MVVDVELPCGSGLVLPNMPLAAGLLHPPLRRAKCADALIHRMKPRISGSLVQCFPQSPCFVQRAAPSRGVPTVA